MSTRDSDGLEALAVSIGRLTDGWVRGSMFDDSPVALHELDRAGVLRRVNDSECRLLGYTQAELLGRPVWDFVDLEDRERSRESVLRKLSSTEDLNPFRRRYRHKDGRVLTVEVYENRILDDAGVCVGMRTILLDVTEKEELARRLEESEHRFRTIVEQIGEGICMVDAEERIEFVNQASERIFGVDRGQLLGRSLRSFVDDETWEEIRRQSQFRQLGMTTSYEMEIRPLDGGRRTLLVTGSPEYNKEGERIGTFGILRDITRRKEAERKLAESEERFRMVASGMNDALVLTDKAGAICYWNRAAVLIFGYSDAEALGKHFVDLVVPARYRARYLEMFGRFHHQGEIPFERETAELLALSKEGRYVPVELSISSFSSGPNWTAFAVIRDITRRKKAEHQLERTAKRLEETLGRAQEANRAKSEFLASMSHEIRTPMNGIIGMSGLLMETKLSEDQQFFADAIRRSADALLDIINDILDFSKIEARQVTLESVPFDLNRVMTDAMDVVTPKAAEKRLNLGLVFEAGTPRKVVGDPGRVRQIMLNLLGNALKFTEAGQVVASVSAGPVTDGRAWFTVAVRDTGIGIEPARIPMLFERFTQADSSTTRKHGGTGLGLAIAKQLTELMGGTIEAESQPGQGSTFRFRVPLQVAGPAGVDKKAVAVAEAQERREQRLETAGKAENGDGTPAQFRARALLVEDHHINQKLGVRMLEKLGCRVDVASNGAEAVQISADVPYDIIFMDCQMPLMDGFEATRRIRERENGGARVPIVAMTASAMQGDQQRCLAAGMDDYISKPVFLEKLRNCLRQWTSGPE